jgi:peptide-methionine (R)-S-oxide reductase
VHRFAGEGYTPKDMRYCINSVSLQLEPERPNQ